MDTWLDSNQWTAVAAVVAALGAVATAGVAVWALTVAKGQLRAFLEQSKSADLASEKNLAAIGTQIATAQDASTEYLAELERHRKLTFRPIVYPVAARTLPIDESSDTLVIKVENVGMGPVLRIDLEAWVFPVADEATLGSYVRAVVQHAEEIQTMPPTCLGSLLAPGRAGYSCEPIVRGMSAEVAFALPRRHSYDVFVRLRYHDVHGETYSFPDVQPAQGVLPTPLLARRSTHPIEAQWKGH